MRPGISIANRVVSGLPLSVGTSHAFESLFDAVQSPYDAERQVPNRISPTDFDSCYVNLDTLFRNLVGALEKVQFQQAEVSDLVATMEDEVDVITHLFMRQAFSCKPIFYYTDYRDLKRKVDAYPMKLVKIKEAKTDNQKHYEATRLAVLKQMNRNTDIYVEYHGAVLPKGYERSIILTHCPYDLVSFSKFKDLQLLESNTGVIKTRDKWNSKLHQHPSRSLANIPFHEKTLLVFGDRHQLSPVSLNMRDAVLDVAEKKNWTALTTLEKLTLDIELTARDPALVAAWKML